MVEKCAKSFELLPFCHGKMTWFLTHSGKLNYQVFLQCLPVRKTNNIVFVDIVEKI